MCFQLKQFDKFDRGRKQNEYNCKRQNVHLTYKKTYIQTYVGTKSYKQLLW
jgi:hypothetical protein